MKKIAEQKQQGYSAGSNSKRVLSRKEQEELKKREDDEAAAHVFKEFVETFQQPQSNISKVWVKAGTYDAGSRKEDFREKGKLYRPTAKVTDSSDRSSSDKTQDYARYLANDNKKDSLLKKKTQEKKKSNLELFKEELRQIQEEREERHKYKSFARNMLPASEPDPVLKETEIGSFDNGDPYTTNLYLGNLNPKISEQQLMELFGKYGPLASIKIMWPRSEEEKSRGRNCGFVAYMSRKDAERALRGLNGIDVMNYEMKLGWGKSVPIMTHPIYIPPALIEYSMPPPQSGLPFNAQSQNDGSSMAQKFTSKDYIADSEIREEMDKFLYKSIVKVVIPTERQLLMLIHRMIEFVIREGPMFEAMIMNREIDNPMFRFLFENESPSHIYYRWKLFSLLQGDTPSEWKQNEFRMFIDGSIWKPPATNFYTQGMPDELISEEDLGEPNKGALSTAQRDRLEYLLRHLTPERAKIGDAMIFCIEHAEAADEICECIAESLSGMDTLVHKIIGRIYLVSDILHNCSVKVQNASFFRKAMEKTLVEMFKGIHASYMGIESRLKAEGFKVRIMQMFRAWEEWALYPRDFLNKLQNIFLGYPVDDKDSGDIDGAPLSGDEKDDEDLNGVPLDGAALLKGALLRGVPEVKSSTTTRGTPLRAAENNSDIDDDIDGVPLDEDIDGIPLDNIIMKVGAFVPSKWETIPANQVEAQAVTTSKWETLDPVAPDPPLISRDYDNSSDSEDNYQDSNYEDERRLRLREIEVKTMQYQDELESGQRTLKPGWSMSEQIEYYRRKLIKKSEKEMRQQHHPESDSSPDKYSSSRRERNRSSSPNESFRRTKSRRSSSSEYYKHTSPRSSRHRSSRSPVSYSRRARDSTSPQPKIKSKRHRTRSQSPLQISPKRYMREQHSDSSSSSGSPRRYRSPSPKSVRYHQVSPSRSARRGSPGLSRMTPSTASRELSPYAPVRHRSEKHKHKHK